MKYTEFHRRINFQGLEVRPRRRLALLLHQGRQALAPCPLSWGKGGARAVTAEHSASDGNLTEARGKGAPLSSIITNDIIYKDMANEIIMLISASADSFGACSENCPGIWAAGDTVEACKADTVQAIELIKKNMPRKDWPEPLKAGEYTITWRYDIESFLYYYGRFISLAGMERITGINQKQLWAYMHGRKKPRQAQKEKITNALHRFARELAAAVIL